MLDSFFSQPRRRSERPRRRFSAPQLAPETLEARALLAAPTITSFGGNVAFTENGAPVVLTSTAVVADADSPTFNGGVLTATQTSNVQPLDQLDIQSSGSLFIDQGTHEVVFGGILVGMFAGGAGGTPLSVTFNNNATAPIVQTVLQNVIYSNPGDDLAPGAKGVTVTLSDGVEVSVPRSKSILPTAVNDRPQLDLRNASQAASNPGQFFTIDVATDQLFKLDATGQFTLVGDIGFDFFRNSNLAFKDGLLYATTPDTDDILGPVAETYTLLVIDPLTAGIIRTVPITVDGVAPTLCDGLAARNGELLVGYSTFANGHTGTLDPITGVITETVDYGSTVDIDGLGIGPNGELIAVDSIGLSAPLAQIAYFRLSEDPLNPQLTFLGDYVSESTVLDIANDGVDLFSIDILQQELIRLQDVFVGDYRAERIPLGARGATATTLEADLRTRLVQGGPAVLIAPGAVLTDPDSNFNGASLTVTTVGAKTASDLLNLRQQGTGPGQIFVTAAGLVRFGGLAVGNLTGGVGGTQLQVAFNANASLAAVQAVVQNLQFNTDVLDGATLGRRFQIFLNDGDGGTITGDGAVLNRVTTEVAFEVLEFPPVITIGSGAQTYTENAAPARVMGSARLNDPDTPSYPNGSLAVSITQNRQATDLLGIRTGGSGATAVAVAGNTVLVGGVPIATFLGGGGTGFLFDFNASAGPANVQTLLRAITFENVSDNPASATRTVQFTFDADGLLGTPAATVQQSVIVVPVNDAPVLTPGGGAATYDPEGPPVFVAPFGQVADPDSANFFGGQLTAQLTSGSEGTDRLAVLARGQVSVVGSNVLFAGSVVGTMSGGSGAGILTISFNSALATRAAVQEVLRSIGYRSVTADPTAGTRTASFRLTDGDGGTSNLAAKPVNVLSANDPPALTQIGPTVMFVENSPAVLIAPAGTVVDPDSLDFGGGSLTAHIIGGGNASDRLELREQPTDSGQITIVSGKLLFGGIQVGTISGGVGTTPLVVQFNTQATRAIVELTLQNLTYRSASENPAGTRTVRFVVSDGDDGTSPPVDLQILVEGVADAPVIDNLGGPATYVEGAAPLALASAATVADPDSPDFAAGSLTVRISANGRATDRLAIRNQGSGAGQIGVTGDLVRFGGVTIGTFLGGDGTTPLVITLSSGAGVAAVRALVRNITFVNLSNDPGAATRTVSFVLDDGDGGTSAPALKSVAVQQFSAPPQLANPLPFAFYFAGLGAVQPAAFASVVDPDTTVFDGGRLTVSLVAGSAPQDRLAIRNQGNAAGQIGVSGTQVRFGGQVIGTFTPGDASQPLTVDLTAGASLAAVQALLRNVSFLTTTGNARAGNRTLRLQLNDGEGGLSAAVQSTVFVFSFNFGLSARQTAVAKAAVETQSLVPNVVAKALAASSTPTAKASSKAAPAVLPASPVKPQQVAAAFRAFGDWVSRL